MSQVSPVVECPVCSESFRNFESLEEHFSNCLSQHKGHLPPQRQQSVKDELFVIKMMWDEQQAVLKKKEDEEALTLEFLKQQKSSQMKCDHCCEEFFFNDLIHLDCGHKFCKPDLHNDVAGRISQKQYNDFTCLTCEVPLTSSNLNSALSQKEIENLEEKQLLEYMRSHPELFVFCPHCNKGFEKVQQSEEEVKKRLKDQQLISNEVNIHRERNRIMCRYCHEDFCMSCLVCPFHEDYTCVGYQDHLVTTRCRYCDEGVTIVDLLSPPSLQNICSSDACQEKKKIACIKTLKCGHFCCGIRDEREHLSCMNEECEKISKQESDQKKNENNNNNNNNKKRKKRKKKEPKKVVVVNIQGSDYCNICWVESLIEAPCIQLKCGHVFHFSCIIEKLEKGWGTPMITFGFLNCPLCKVPMHHKSIRNALEPIEKLRKGLHKKMFKRMKFEGMDRDDSLKKGGKYYRNKKQFAEDKLAYYQCHECKTPYFGGMRSCEDVGEEREFKKEELVCGSCVAKKLSITKSCPLHGTEFIEWKCKYCCNLSRWFCWGSTHFCDKCHKVQVETQKMTKLRRDELMKCKGKGKCPSGGNHPPNGEEFPVGCSICRKNLEF